jgi:hypothetical protein
MHFCSHLCTPEKTSGSVTHPEIATDQARLTPEFIVGGLPKMKVYLGGMSILSILLSLESGCHNPPPIEDRQPHRSAPRQKRPLLATFVCSLSSICTIQYPSQRTHMPCIRTHVPDPYTTVSFSTDPYALVKPRGSPLIPFVTPQLPWA